MAGTYTVSVRGGSNVTRDLTLGGASGTQTLEVSGSAADGNATLALLDQGHSDDGVLVNGRVVLTTTEAGAWSRIDVKSGPLWNAGEIVVEPGAGNLGGRYLYGEVFQAPPMGRGARPIIINESLDCGLHVWKSGVTVAYGKTLGIGILDLQGTRTLSGNGTVEGRVLNIEGQVAPGSSLGTLAISGLYRQYGRASLAIEINGPGAGEFDVLAARHTVQLVGGTLALEANFKATLGQTFPILSSGSLTGRFAKETGGVIDRSSGLYYAPTYRSKGVTLQVKQAALNISPASGPPGTSVTVNGSGWLAGEGVAIIFADRGGQKTVFQAAGADGSGNFSTTITIPGGAESGAGSIRAKSAITNLTLRKTFTVT